MLRRIFKNDYVLNVFNKVITILMGVLSTAFLTRYLGLELRGAYAFITQAAGVAVLVLNFGIHQSYSYFYRQNNGEVYQKYLNLYTLQMIVYSVLAILVGVAFRNNETVVMVSVLIPFAVMYQQMESTMAVENIRLKIKMHIINSAAKLVLYGLIFFLRTQIGTSIAIPVAVTALIDLCTVLVYARSNGKTPHPFVFDTKFSGSVIRYSWKPMIIAMLITLNYNVDIFFLKAMGTSTELSLYSTAAGILNYIWLLPDAFKEVLVSRVARKNDINTVNLTLKVSVAVVVAVYIGFAIFGKFALALLYGAEFVPAYAVVMILVFGCISMVFYKIIGVLMLANGTVNFYFYSLLASAVVNIVLNYFLIPFWGMYGAAWASVGSYSVCGIALLSYYCVTNHQSLSMVLGWHKGEIRSLVAGKRGKK